MTFPFRACAGAALKRRELLALGLAAQLSVGTAFAQAPWPSRPVRIVLPFPPGGASDTAVRPIAQRVGDILGQPLTIDFKTGGNAVVAANAVLSSPKDGYTFLWDAANQLTNPVLVKDLQIDYRSAFIPVTMAVRAPQVVLVRSDFPARNFEEFLAVARSKPGAVSCGTPPAGAMGHLALALLQQRADIRLIHTPYRGGSEAARDVMGGQIDSVVVTTATARGMLATGKVRMLAVTSAARLPAYPDIPTIAERGFPGYDMDDWFGLFAAAGTPDAAIRRLQAAVAQAARDPSLGETLASFGLVLVANSSEEFAGWLGRQRDLLEKLIRDNQITIS